MLNAKRKLEMAKASDQKKLQQLLLDRKPRGPWPQAVGWYHRVGMLLNRLCPKNSPQDRGALPRLVAAMDYRDPAEAKRIIQECYKFRDLAVTYPDVNVLKSFKHIRWGHLRILCSVSSLRQRQKWETLCERQGLACDALSLRVQSKKRGGKKSNGRRVYKSRSIEPISAIHELDNNLDRLNDLCNDLLDHNNIMNPKAVRHLNSHANLIHAFDRFKEKYSQHKKLIKEVWSSLKSIISSLS